MLIKATAIRAGMVLGADIHQYPHDMVVMQVFRQKKWVVIQHPTPLGTFIAVRRQTAIFTADEQVNRIA